MEDFCNKDSAMMEKVHRLVEWIRNQPELPKKAVFHISEPPHATSQLPSDYQQFISDALKHTRLDWHGPTILLSLYMSGQIICDLCICAKACDCQCPDPKNGVALGSETCPEHNRFPKPYSGCPVHDPYHVLWLSEKPKKPDDPSGFLLI